MVVFCICYLTLGTATGLFLLLSGRLRSNDSDVVMDRISAVAVGLGWWIYWGLSFLVFCSLRTKTKKLPHASGAKVAGFIGHRSA